MNLPVTPRLFSLREANALLPALRKTFTEARSLRDRLGAVQSELEAAGYPLQTSRVEVDDASPAAVQSLQREAGALVNQLLAVLREVSELGLEVKGAEGLVDFRSRHEGRIVYLCWRYGEEDVAFFHELDTGFAGRRPCLAGGQFLGDLLH